MQQKRITNHPIIPQEHKEKISFYWQNQTLTSYKDETIASALIANGINVFGEHVKDKAPLGIFCANGQCSQCMVLVDDVPVKSCMTLVKPGIHVNPVMGLVDLPEVNLEGSVSYENSPSLSIPVLIIGGGPAGLSAAIELGRLGAEVILIDDKHRLGGKLVLQTHRFFGSTDAVFAGTRGIDIATKLDKELRNYPNVDVWLESTAVAVFEDRSVGVWKEGKTYLLVKPEVLLVATGAREKSLAFPGNTLPGVFGAGAFQTLVNRDLVKPSEQLFVIGGGNVGLIASYHALQAGINVVGLVEALPECGGYKVHRDKLARLGVPIYTSHTIIQAHGETHVSGVTIAAVDRSFNPIPGSEKSFECDTILIAVGLDPVDEFTKKAKEVGLQVYSAGDANEIAEASAAIFSGKIIGVEIANNIGVSAKQIPNEWFEFELILKSKPGLTHSANEDFENKGKIFPLIHCTQEIPCDPCSSVCPKHLIHIDKVDIRNLPSFCPEGENVCIGCERCVAVCPGLAITLVDYRKDINFPTVTIPLEFNSENIKEKDFVTVTNTEGEVLASLPIIKIRQLTNYSSTQLVHVISPKEIATKISGIQIRPPEESLLHDQMFLKNLEDETYICRCERVTVGEVRQLIKNGERDINQIKALTKLSMGACGGKTCLKLIRNVFREEGVKSSEITDTVIRPVFVEIPLETLAGLPKKDSTSL